MILNSPYISGSLTVTGNTTIQGQLTVTGSLSGTASLASNALLLQGTGSTGFATTASLLQVSSSQQSISASQQQISASFLTLTASYNAVSASQQQISASQQQISSSYIALSASYNTFSGSASTRVTQIEQVYATTGSNSFRATQSITGSLVVSSTITAQTLVVQTITSSVEYSSGSNIFGSTLTNTQTFTGSMNITGSNHTIFGNVGIGTTPSTKLHICGGSAYISNNPGTDGFVFGSASSFLKYAYITSTNDGAQKVGLSFNTTCDAGTTNQERLKIVSDTGYVGIGASSPDRKLDISTITAADTKLVIRTACGFAGCYSPSLDFHVGGYESTCTTGQIKMCGANNYSGDMIFSTQLSGTINPLVERMRITSGGNVGINCSAPSGKLQVANSSTQYAIYTSTGNLELYTPEGNCGYVRLGSAYNLNGLYGGCGLNYLAAGTSNHIFYTTDSPTERMRITSTGIACFACQVCAKKFIGSSTIAFGSLTTGTQSVACQSIESLWALASNRSTATKGAQYGNGTWYIQGYTSAGSWIYYKFLLHDPVWFRAYVYLVNYADTSLRKGCLQYSVDNSASFIDLANATNWQYGGTLDGSIALSGDSKYITLRWDSGGGASTLVGWNAVELTACASAFYSINGLG